MAMPLKYDHIASEWCAHYRSGLSVWKIGALYGVGGQSVHNYLVRHGVDRRPLTDAIRKEPINRDAFVSLDADGSYWLGMMYADGNVTLHKTTGFYAAQLVAHSDDEETIAGFLKYLGLTGPINRRDDKNAVQTRVTSKALCARLMELGVVPRKTHTIEFPKFLPETSVRHFVRGYLDGDGCVHFRLRPRYVTPQGTVTFCGNPKFISGLDEAICRQSGLSPTGRQSRREGRTVTISYEGRTRLLALFDYLYGDGGPRLSRKYNAFREGLGLAA